MTEATKPSTVFWVVAILATIWNAIGCMNYLGTVYMTEQVMAALPADQQAYYAELPAWVTAAFATSVWSALIACVGLLLRKKWAVPLFMLSLVAVLVQAVYNFFMQDTVAITGSNLVITILVMAISVFLVWYSKDARNKGILR